MNASVARRVCARARACVLREMRWGCIACFCTFPPPPLCRAPQFCPSERATPRGRTTLTVHVTVCARHRAPRPSLAACPRRNSSTSDGGLPTGANFPGGRPFATCPRRKRSAAHQAACPLRAHAACALHPVRPFLSRLPRRRRPHSPALLPPPSATLRVLAAGALLLRRLGTATSSVPLVTAPSRLGGALFFYASKQTDAGAYTSRQDSSEGPEVHGWVVETKREKKTKRGARSAGNGKGASCRTRKSIRKKGDAQMNEGTNGRTSARARRHGLLTKC